MVPLERRTVARTIELSRLSSFEERSGLRHLGKISNPFRMNGPGMVIYKLVKRDIGREC